MLFLRAVTAFLVLPGTFAGLIPALIVSADRWRRPGHILGAVPLVIRFSLLVWCVRDFYIAGKGTLAPWDPPRHLVVVGLYRFVRNRMYVAIMSLLIGWAWVAVSPLLGAYAILVAIAFHLRVILHEEPRLSRQFDHEWTDAKKGAALAASCSPQK